MTPGDNSYREDQNYLTDVGAFTGSPSHYGTFDQGGNVHEWNDRVYSDKEGTRRGFRGGCWDYGWYGMHPTRDYKRFPENDKGNTGFRLVYVPEPATATLAALGLLGVALRRRGP